MGKTEHRKRGDSLYEKRSSTEPDFFIFYDLPSGSVVSRHTCNRGILAVFG